MARPFRAIIFNALLASRTSKKSLLGNKFPTFSLFLLLLELTNCLTKEPPTILSGSLGPVKLKILTYKTLIEKSNEVDSMKLNTSIEAMAPPNEMILQDYKDGMQFEYYAKKNLNNSEMPYTLRSNNPLGVHIMGGNKKWEGELDEQATAKDGGSVLATFKHPAWGVRAAVTLMINKSELTKGINDVTKLYGHTPTVIEIITGHTAKKSIEGYLQSLEKNFGIDRNMNINLLDGDDVIPLLHAMTLHEMGIENYNKYWKGNEAMLFYYLKKGYDLSIKKYNTSK